MGANIEGPVSALCTDTNKFQCSNCNGSKMYISKLIDDPNDVAGDTNFAALLISGAGLRIFGIVALCSQCGHEQVPYWYIEDVGANTGAATTMTNMVTSTTADLLTGLYAYPLVGTDIGKYFIITTNTAADPVVITTTVAPNDDSDGYWIITNLLPTGLTVAS